uniref:Uncharacterized protein n=1 Tax=Anguilla anguilla TaxID=7936 RepID=A0A0E9PUC4_ANGAN
MLVVAQLFLFAIYPCLILVMSVSEISSKCVL